jgi:Domain of unknown function (DUF5753)
MDWSLSKIIRIEGGSVGISTNDIKALLACYQITDEDKIRTLVELARGARERSWWSVYADVANPRYLQYIEYETAAFTMRSFQPLVIPGILQTYEYAQAIMRQFAPYTSEGRTDALVDLRVRRQELLERPEPPYFYFVLDEAVVRRMVGGQSVMRQQLRRLLELADRPNVSIELVPFSAGVHPGLEGSFVILEFSDAVDDDVLYLETNQGGMIKHDDQEEILTYREIFEQLRSMSLGPAGSMTYIGEIVSELK